MRTLRFGFAAILFAVCAARAEVLSPTELGKERVILHTNGGDIVLALYPKVAPRTCEQFLEMVSAGVYDGTRFHRLDPNFVLQNAGHNDRPEPLTGPQRETVHKLKAEFSRVPHKYGVLSMAHADGDPDSGESSFSIMLAAAPHLDGKYTVFGEVVRGMDVVEMFKSVPRDAQFQPKVRISVLKAEVLETPDAYARASIAGPKEIPYTKEDAERDKRAEEQAIARFVPAFAGVVLAMMLLLSVAQFLFAEKIPPKTLASVQLISVLVGAFFAIVLLTPAAQHRESLAMLVFLGILGLFKLMGRFEAPGGPPKKEEAKKAG
ncbi:MAG: peptidylprolyl isomerase [Planctomycetes bacterium]|nr:peptidylprolyl isomerase [Planctomycetota bacterium]